MLLLNHKRDYEGVELLYRESLAIREKTHGGDHPVVATVLNNIAQLLSKKGDYDGAITPQQEALAIWKKISW